MFAPRSCLQLKKGEKGRRKKTAQYRQWWWLDRNANGVAQRCVEEDQLFGRTCRAICRCIGCTCQLEGYRSSPSAATSCVCRNSWPGHLRERKAKRCTMSKLIARASRFAAIEKGTNNSRRIPGGIILADPRVPADSSATIFADSFVAVTPFCLHVDIEETTIAHYTRPWPEAGPGTITTGAWHFSRANLDYTDARLPGPRSQPLIPRFVARLLSCPLSYLLC